MMEAANEKRRPPARMSGESTNDHNNNQQTFTAQADDARIERTLNQIINRYTEEGGVE